MTLTPAYGRDYKSKKEVQADFDADRDFLIADIVHPDCGRYVNKTQLAEAGETLVMIRYSQNRKINVFKL